MIKIIDVGVSNAGSIRNMLRYLGVDSAFATSSSDLNDASAIILPGVGSFDHAISSISPILPALEQKVLSDKIPFLGVCLGMQLLFESSDEGVLPGFGWLKGHVSRFNFDFMTLSNYLRVPHMGWNLVSPTQNSEVFSGFESDPRFYFVHSYHVNCVDSSNAIAYSNYGYDFVCAVNKENIWGVQFHPEKSHRFGIHFFKNFLKKIDYA
jgi:glutamine amidotransferase